MRIIRFKVEGSGVFPLDMLRYDECWPLSGADSGIIHESGKRIVELRGLDPSGGRPTRWRWLSFMWPLVPDSMVEES